MTLANAETTTKTIPNPIMIKPIQVVDTKPLTGFTLTFLVFLLIKHPAIENNTHRNTRIEVQLAIKSTKEYS
jgi:hypothetical protein